MKIYELLFSEKLKKILGGKFDKLINANVIAEKIIEIKLEKYYKSNVNKFSCIKTIINPNRTYPINNIYVQLDLGLYNETEKRFSIKKIEELFKLNSKIILIGLAGIGKSTYMKYLYINSTIKDYISLFIELRRLPYENEKKGVKDNNLIQLMLDFFSSEEIEIDKELFHKMLEKGKFIFFFDGFDEVNYDLQDHIGNQINSMSEKFSKNKFIISSRNKPWFALNNLFDFCSMELKEMTEPQIKKLINKIYYNYYNKNKLFSLKEIKDEIIDNELFYLTNPLFILLVILVYSKNLKIPNKLHLFYQNAYEALFYRYYEEKTSQIKIKPKCLLDIFEFEKILSGFCFLSYIQNQLVFDTLKINEILEKVSEIYPEINFDKEKFICDMIEYVCILVIDGLQYTFIHKTFQEYFVARFIINPGNKKKENIFKILIYKLNLHKKNIYDRAMEMACLMDKEIIAEYYIIPIIKIIKKEKEIVDIFNLKTGRITKLFFYIFDKISIIENKWKLNISDNKYAYFFYYIVTYYYEINTIYEILDPELKLILKNEKKENLIIDIKAVFTKKNIKLILNDLMPCLKAIEKIFYFEKIFLKSVKSFTSKIDNIFLEKKTM